MCRWYGETILRVIFALQSELIFNNKWLLIRQINNVVGVALWGKNFN